MLRIHEHYEPGQPRLKALLRRMVQNFCNVSHSDVIARQNVFPKKQSATSKLLAIEQEINTSRIYHHVTDYRRND